MGSMTIAEQASDLRAALSRFSDASVRCADREAEEARILGRARLAIDDNLRVDRAAIWLSRDLIRKMRKPDAPPLASEFAGGAYLPFDVRSSGSFFRAIARSMDDEWRDGVYLASAIDRCLSADRGPGTWMVIAGLSYEVALFRSVADRLKEIPTSSGTYGPECLIAVGFDEEKEERSDDEKELADSLLPEFCALPVNAGRLAGVAAFTVTPGGTKLPMDRFEALFACHRLVFDKLTSFLLAVRGNNHPLAGVRRDQLKDILGIFFRAGFARDDCMPFLAELTRMKDSRARAIKALLDNDPIELTKAVRDAINSANNHRSTLEWIGFARVAGLLTGQVVDGEQRRPFDDAVRSLQANDTTQLPGWKARRFAAAFSPDRLMCKLLHPGTYTPNSTLGNDVIAEMKQLGWPEGDSEEAIVLWQAASLPDGPERLRKRLRDPNPWKVDPRFSLDDVETRAWFWTVDDSMSLKGATRCAFPWTVAEDLKGQWSHNVGKHARPGAEGFIERATTVRVANDGRVIVALSDPGVGISNSTLRVHHRPWT